MKQMPVVFIGHGSPENATEENEFAAAWRRLGQELPKPKAILCVSAHWLTDGVGVTAVKQPKTIHDFGGFPEELYQIKYKAAGSPDLAERVRQLVKTEQVQLDTGWGFDHGCWVPLLRMYPGAEIPVIQLSLDPEYPTDKHFEVGRQLAPLREEGVLIVGSGNLVHNLMLARMSLTAKPYEWTVSFDNFVKESLLESDFEGLINYQDRPDAAFAHPTNDHYLPILYVAGAAGKKGKPRFLCETFWAGSFSMRCVVYD